MRNGADSPGSGAPAHFEVFRYPADLSAVAEPTWEGWSETASEKSPAAESPSDTGTAEAEAVRRAEFERQMGEQTRKSFEAGRERGLQEGRQAEREAQAAAHGAEEQKRMRQASDLADAFARERDQYFLQVEREVVLLALGIAARILRREAQMDPLLLTGAVRVALGQLSATTEIKLHVPSSELDLWTDAMALIPNLAVKPVLCAGDGMRLGDCTVETRLGTVDLGVRSQLGEIERGFFDRAGTPAGARPSARTKSPEGGTELRS